MRFETMRKRKTSLKFGASCIRQSSVCISKNVYLRSHKAWDVFPLWCVLHLGVRRTNDQWLWLSRMPSRFHRGSSRPASMWASTVFALLKQWLLQHRICHRGSIEAHGGPPRCGPRYLFHCKEPLFLAAVFATSHTPSRLHRGPPRYGLQQLYLCKNNDFCNISYAIEHPSKLIEARLDTGLDSFCIVKTILFARSSMPSRIHRGSLSPSSIQASTASAL